MDVPEVSVPVALDANDVRFAFISRLDQRGRAFVDRKDRLCFTKLFYEDMGLMNNIAEHKNTISSVYKGLKSQICPAFMREDDELVKMYYRVSKTYQSNLLNEEKAEPTRKRKSVETKKDRYLSVIRMMQESEQKEQQVKMEIMDPDFMPSENQTPIRNELERMKYSLLTESARIRAVVKGQEEKIFEYGAMVRRIDELLKKPGLPATLSELNL